MDTLRKIEIGAGVLLVAGVIGVYSYAHHQTTLANTAAQNAKYWEATAEAHKEAADKVKSDVKAIEAKNQELQAANKVLRDRYQSLSKPTPPAPVPSDDASLVLGLQVAGLKQGLKIHVTPLESDISKDDAFRIWDLAEKAKLADGLGIKLGMADEVIASDGKTIDGLKAESAKKTEAIEETEKARVAEAKRAEELQLRVGAMAREATGKKVTKWFEILGGIALGYVVGSKLK